MKQLSLLFFLMLFVACQSTGESTSATNHLLSPTDFQEGIAKASDEILIDLRTHGELHSIGPIAGAKMLEFGSKNFENRLTTLPKDKAIYFYCASGGRSGKTAEMLKNAGYTNYYDLDGGITAWKEAGLPIQSHSH